MDTLYAEALKLAENQPSTATAISRVAKATSDEAARWAFSQWVLRKRGLAKFARASEMLFDQEGLEMATHETLAAYHASLFPSGEAVFDLTAGIGADLIALAKRGPAVGFEIDIDRAELARHNLAVHGVEAEIIALPFSSKVGEKGLGIEGLELGNAASSQATTSPDLHPPAPCSISESELQLATPWCREMEEGEPGYIFADPARRSAGRKFTDPSEFQPNPLEVIEQFKDCQLGVIKLSPMLPDDFLDSLGKRLEFVSFGGECREALVAFGSLAKPGRFAVHVESGAVVPADDLFLEESEEPAEFLYEADPAAIRAHALGNLSEELGLVALSDSNGYLTGESEVQSPWLTGFRALEFGRFDQKILKKRLAELDSTTPILKQRGTKLDLQKLQKQLILKGARNLEVAFYAVGNSVRQVILERLR